MQLGEDLGPGLVLGALAVLGGRPLRVSRHRLAPLLLGRLHEQLGAAVRSAGQLAVERRVDQRPGPWRQTPATRHRSLRMDGRQPGPWRTGAGRRRARPAPRPRRPTALDHRGPDEHGGQRGPSPEPATSSVALERLRPGARSRCGGRCRSMTPKPRWSGRPSSTSRGQQDHARRRCRRPAGRPPSGRRPSGSNRPDDSSSSDSVVDSPPGQDEPVEPVEVVGRAAPTRTGSPSSSSAASVLADVTLEGEDADGQRAGPATAGGPGSPAAVGQVHAERADLLAGAWPRRGRSTPWPRARRR